MSPKTRTSLQDRVLAAASTVIEPGETVQAAALAQVGQVSLGKQLKTAGATAVLSLGMFTTTLVPKTRPVVLTDRRLLVLEMDRGQPLPRLVGAMPRQGLRARRRPWATLWSSSPLTLPKVYDVLDAGGRKVVRLTFDIRNKAHGRQLVEALGPS